LRKRVHATTTSMKWFLPYQTPSSVLFCVVLFLNFALDGTLKTSGGGGGQHTRISSSSPLCFIPFYFFLSFVSL
jgi:hypothetical protein